MVLVDDFIGLKMRFRTHFFCAKSTLEPIRYLTEIYY